MGLALGSGLIFLIVWLRGRGIKLAWYEWLVGILGITTLLFTIQNYQASVAELEPTAPGMFLVVFGIPAVILLALAVFLVWFRHFRVVKKEKGSSQAAKA